MRSRVDLAIVGSGFGGSLLAMIARRLGLSVALLEREKHPRFAIGESSTPLANLLLEQLAARYDLPRVAPLTRWGAWRRAYPEMRCGLKRGFTFFNHSFDREWAPLPDRRNELLVAASPFDRIADTHWHRADFDWFLVREAIETGAELIDEVQLTAARADREAVRIEGRRRGETVDVKARFVVDASGPRGFLHRALGLREAPSRRLPRTEGLYSHFRGVERWDRLYTSAETPPYPVDDAAVHHVFNGGWIWVLRFHDGHCSAGVAAASGAAREFGLSDGPAAWSRLMSRLPAVGRQFQGAEAVRPFTHLPSLAFKSERAVGGRWALLPSAAGFIDPLLSTGFALTLLGVRRLAEFLENDWETDRASEALARFEDRTFAELGAVEELIAALYSSMDDFELFVALSLLYFAAASFTETAWRLNRPELAGPTFLLGERPEFAAEFRTICRGALSARAESDRRGLIPRIYKAIEPVDVAGLSDRSRRNWHPVRFSDLLGAASKLESEESSIQAMLDSITGGT